ncbi:phospholipase A1-like [Harmonia axyridis]|uniref:phospholipase A1-like n=1 Tax=Harmonia axyridis TaxID=115357 RepID=UPI001E27615D|nr:phospholipase A1-like [Harmonia axyridis]
MSVSKMKLLWVFVIAFYCQESSAGILGDLLSTVSDVSSKVVGVADSAIGGTLSTLQEVTGRPVDLNDIKFFLYTNLNPEEPLIVNPLYPVSLGSNFQKIFFLIHGRQQSTNSPWMRNLTRSLLRRYPGCAVVHVDWRGPASGEYALAVFNTESVGKHVAELIKRMNRDHNVPTQNIVLIGFSLGSQVCGFTGKHFKQLTGTKLPRIVALDPAGVLFSLRPEYKRLNPEDATVVHVVHTDGGKIGVTQPCGTIDFYPNGGKDQPGCPHVDGVSINDNGQRKRLLSLRNVGKFLNSVNCDHERAYQYFVESVDNVGSFAAKKCAGLTEVGQQECSGNMVAMGDLELTEIGVFYLETKSYAPFSKSSLHDSLFYDLFGGDGQIDVRIQK